MRHSERNESGAEHDHGPVAEAPLVTASVKEPENEPLLPVLPPVAAAPRLESAPAFFAHAKVCVIDDTWVIVGSDLKTDGGTWNPVDQERVKRFLEAAGRA